MATKKARKRRFPVHQESRCYQARRFKDGTVLVEAKGGVVVDGFYMTDIGKQTEAQVDTILSLLDRAYVDGECAVLKQIRLALRIGDPE